MAPEFVRLLAALAASLLLSACVQTSRVDDATTTQSLTSNGAGVAVMRLGAASWACAHASVLIGVRDGNGYRGVRGVRVANMRSVTESAVAEVELPPGEYHFLAYRCMDKNGVGNAVGSLSDKPNVYIASFAKFTLGPGEIVNIGYLHYNASRTNRSMFGRPIREEISVTDWPLEELDRFKKNRPQIYAQMKTRLMQIVTDPGPSETDCARLATLQREGKVATLPPACQPPKTAAKR